MRQRTRRLSSVPVGPGSIDWGPVDRRASSSIVIDAEKGEQSVTVSHDGPLTIINGAMPDRFKESAFVNVALEAITDQPALERIVVAPLAALLRGERTVAIDLLRNIPTVLWPSVQAGPTEDEEDDTEQA